VHGAAWPALLEGWLGLTPDRLLERGDTGDTAPAALAASVLAELALEVPVLVHGDVAPWNVLVADGSVVLLDPMAKVGPAVFDHARWLVTATLSARWSGPGAALGDESLAAQLELSMPDNHWAGQGPLRAAVVLELLNRSSFDDPRWPAGYESLLVGRGASVP
jgi:aminoglycoside phosphotransferase (APT) family kinase protein